MFAMLINSFKVVSSRSKVNIYADDLSIIQDVPSSFTDHAQLEINNLLSWADENQLFIIHKKTFMMNINPHQYDLPLIHLCDNLINTTTSLKLLGILFTNNLN